MIYLSIIIPCYNVAAYLPKTLESLSQLKNAENCEFIFVNDGSKDSTLSIIEKFVHDDKRAILINQTNQGVSAARNAALDIAQGEYILCLDGDDYLHTDTIEIIEDHIEHVDALIAPCIIIDDQGNRLIQTLPMREGNYSIDQLYSICTIFPTAPQLIYKASIIKEFQLRFNPSIKSGEIYDFTVSFFEHANKVSVSKQGFYHYVMRQNSATHMPNYEADLSVLNILDHFNSINTNWANSSSFLLTEFKIITSFTYNKYLRNNLTNHKTIQVVELLLSDNRVKKLFDALSHKNIRLFYKIHIYYLRYMPISAGYKLCSFLMCMMNYFSKK